MKVPITMLLLTCLALASEGQRSQRTQARSSSRSTFKIKNVVREEDGARIQCLSCSSDFSSRALDTTDSCYNPNSASLDKVKHTLITLCPPESVFCKVEISRVGGVFVGISRSCGGNYCVEACFQRGYGAELEVCTFCCGGILTNETNSYGDTESTLRLSCLGPRSTGLCYYIARTDSARTSDLTEHPMNRSWQMCPTLTFIGQSVAALYIFKPT